MKWSTTDKFKVVLGNFKLVYSEDECRLTIPVELLLGKTADYHIGTAVIRHWDNSSEPFRNDQIATIKTNIFVALDHIQIFPENLLLYGARNSINSSLSSGPHAIKPVINGFR